MTHLFGAWLSTRQARCQARPWMLCRSGGKFAGRMSSRPPKAKRASRMRLQYGASGKILALPVHERVEDRDLVAAREERLGEIAADESCAAGDYCFL